jgi:hypothetical protein
MWARKLVPRIPRPKLIPEGDGMHVVPVVWDLLGVFLG